MPEKTYTKEQLGKRLPAVKPVIVEVLELESEKKVTKDMITMLKEMLAADDAPASMTRSELDEFIKTNFMEKWNDGEEGRESERKKRKAEATAKAAATRAAKKSGEVVAKKEEKKEEKKEAKKAK